MLGIWHNQVRTSGVSDWAANTAEGLEGAPHERQGPLLPCPHGP